MSPTLYWKDNAGIMLQVLNSADNLDSDEQEAREEEYVDATRQTSEPKTGPQSKMTRAEEGPSAEGCLARHRARPVVVVVESR